MSKMLNLMNSLQWLVDYELVFVLFNFPSNFIKFSKAFKYCCNIFLRNLNDHFLEYNQYNILPFALFVISDPGKDYLLWYL